MAGGRVVVVPPRAATFDASAAALVGNTCLYGATGGQLFVKGRAGERFAVRALGEKGGGKKKRREAEKIRGAI